MIIESVARVCGLLEALGRGDDVTLHRFYWYPIDIMAARGEPELGCGDLVDDLADLYADLAPGWRAWLGGAPRVAVLADWALLAFHGRRHAVDALGVLDRVVHDLLPSA